MCPWNTIRPWATVSYSTLFSFQSLIHMYFNSRILAIKLIVKESGFWSRKSKLTWTLNCIPVLQFNDVVTIFFMSRQLDGFFSISLIHESNQQTTMKIIFSPEVHFLDNYNEGLFQLMSGQLQPKSFIGRSQFDSTPTRDLVSKFFQD